MSAPFTDDPTRTGVGRWCQPGDRPTRHWLILFDDAERNRMTFTDEAEARHAFARAEAMGWNCWLFAAAARAGSSQQGAG